MGRGGAGFRCNRGLTAGANANVRLGWPRRRLLAAGYCGYAHFLAHPSAMKAAGLPVPAEGCGTVQLHLGRAILSQSSPYPANAYRADQKT